MMQVISAFFDSIFKLIGLVNKTVNTADNVVSVVEMHSSNLLEQEKAEAEHKTRQLRDKLKAVS